MKKQNKQGGSYKNKSLKEEPSSDSLHIQNKKEIKPHSTKNLSDLISWKYERGNKQKRNSVLFFSIGLCFSLISIITAFEWKFYENGELVDFGSKDATYEELIDVPPTKQQLKPPTKMVQPRVIEIPNEEEIIEDIEIDLDIEMTEEQVIEKIIFDEPEIEMEEEKTEEVFIFVEQQPEPYGGMQDFYNYLSQNLCYPAPAQKVGIDGRVFIQFVVEKDGSLTNIEVAKGISMGCDEEATRVLSMSPKWKPGKQRGRPVRVQMIIPIVFRLLDS